MDKDRARFDSAAEPTWFVMERPNLEITYESTPLPNNATAEDIL